MSDKRYQVMSAIDGGDEDATDYDNYMVLVDTKRNVIVYRDGGEPEDAVLYRDLYAFVEELNRLAVE